MSHWIGPYKIARIYHYKHGSEILNTFQSALWLTDLSKVQQDYIYYMNRWEWANIWAVFEYISFFAEHLQQQVFMSFTLGFQTGKGLCKCFFIQRILYAAFCDKPCLFKDLSIPRSPHLMISGDPIGCHLSMEQTKNYNMFFEFTWKNRSQWKSFHTHP